MSKHTPGPWILHADSRRIESVAVEGRHGIPLTTICTFPNPSFIWDAYNARLICAAPELLDALQGVVGLVQLLSARDDLRADRDAILSNHRMIEAERVLAKMAP